MTILLYFVLLFLGVESGGFQISLMKITEEFGLTASQGGWIVSAQYSALIIMPVLAGRIADKVGVQRVLKTFMLVFSIGGLIVSFSPGIGILLLGIFVIGSGYGVCESMVSTLMAEMYGAESGRYFGIAQGFFSMGAVVSPVVLEYLMSRWNMSWNLSFLFCAAAYAVLLVLICLVSKGSGAGFKMAEMGKKERHPLRKGVLICMLFGLFSYGCLEIGISYYLDRYFVEIWQRPDLSSRVLSAFWLLMIISRLGCSALIRWKRQLMVAGYGLTALFLLLIAGSSHLWAAVAAFPILGIWMAPLYANILSSAAEDNPENSGMATGIVSAGCGVGCVLSPVMLGYLSEFVNLRMGFAILAGLAAAGLGACLAYINIKKKEV